MVRNNHRKRASCRGGCVMQKYTDASRRRSGGSTGYQRCDLSDILLLEDNNDEHHTAKYPLIDMEPISWILIF